MMCVGHYEIIILIYEKFIKKKESVYNNGMLENGLMYLCSYIYYIYKIRILN